MRKYDDGLGRFTSIDPLWEKYYGWTPYHYCFNNPVKLKDYSGLDPGNIFLNRNDAAKDFGNYINARSIKENVEYASNIYSFKLGSKTVYSYDEPVTQNKRSTVEPRKEIPEGTKKNQL